MDSKIKKTYKSLNAVLIACGIICLICYDIIGGLWLKGVTSSWFFILGCVNLYFNHRNHSAAGFPVLMATGLCFGMCADVFLGIWFIAGLLVFALGHVMYLLAFCKLEKFRLRDFCYILPVSAFAIYFVTGTPFVQVDDPFMQKMLILYALIIGAMLGKAISNYFRCKVTSRLVIMVSSILFMFSDLILAIDMFGTSSRLTWILCSYSYWPAQHMLALSLLLFGLQENAKTHPISE